MSYDDRVNKFIDESKGSGTVSKIGAGILLLEGIGIVIMCIFALMFLGGCFYLMVVA